MTNLLRDTAAEIRFKKGKHVGVLARNIQRAGVRQLEIKKAVSRVCYCDFSNSPTNTQAK